MHVITGGAFNGKSKWVRETYKLKHTTYTWLSAYQKDACPFEVVNYTEPFLVLEGVEQWIREQIKEEDSTFTRDDGRVIIKRWLNWEKKHPNRQLIIIGTDISKGIVPMQSIDRKWRDRTGWFFQDLVNHCSRYDVIWYGINKQLK